ncbi:MAG: FAD-dependent oxidoreductase, partial [Rhodospirillaceae bacterium]
MDPTSTPVVKDLVLIGGGHSHVTVLKRFGMQPIPGIRVTLICRDSHTPYSGMLPGFVAGHYDYDEVHIDLGALARFANARFYHSEVVGLNPINQTITCDNRPDVRYDLLSINTGSSPNTSNVPGALENVVPVKPIHNFLNRWEQLTQRAMAHVGPMRIAVVGAGAGGVELLLAARHRIKNLLQASGKPTDALEFHLFGEAPEIMPTHNGLVRSTFTKILEDRDVHLHLGERVIQVSPGSLMTANGSTLDADEILWVTAASAPSWPAKAGL